nr:MAG TPA: hypothetical protein [Caudoviricetes sp.]
MDQIEKLCIVRARGKALARAIADARFGAKPELDSRLQEVQNAILTLNAWLESQDLIPREDRS